MEVTSSADVNQPDEDLSTALHLAGNLSFLYNNVPFTARCGYVECTRLLIKEGAIVDAADEW